jgi:DNA-binding XRE family transcriptional regulator
VLSRRREEVADPLFSTSIAFFAAYWRNRFSGQLTRAANRRIVAPKQKTGVGAMSPVREKFGAFIRRERENKEIGLREMAKMIGVSPTYLSKVERDEFSPPTEDRVRAIAQVIGCDVDELLARAGRVATDLSDIIKRHPVELAALLRTTKGLTTEDIALLARNAQRAKHK